MKIKLTSYLKLVEKNSISKLCIDDFESAWKEIGPAPSFNDYCYGSHINTNDLGDALVAHNTALKMLKNKFMDYVLNSLDIIDHPKSRMLFNVAWGPKNSPDSFNNVFGRAVELAYILKCEEEEKNANCV